MAHPDDETAGGREAALGGAGGAVQGLALISLAPRHIIREVARRPAICLLEFLRLDPEAEPPPLRIALVERQQAARRVVAFQDIHRAGPGGADLGAKQGVVAVPVGLSGRPPRTVDVPVQALAEILFVRRETRSRGGRHKEAPA